jgi:hypothetical protein
MAGAFLFGFLTETLTTPLQHIFTPHPYGRRTIPHSGASDP